MSDRSSESSGDSWVFVNENDDISLEVDETQPLNLELNYDSVCFAASDSIKSSLSSEELEWQHLRNSIDLVPCYSSHVEDLDLHHSQNGHLDRHNQDQTGGIELSSCCSSNHYEEDVDIDIVAVHKLHSYKHHRNDHLNFILNIMLALTVSSALGLGTGHFLGWSHKCWRNIPYFKEANNHIVPNAVLINQNTEDFLSTEKETSPTFSKDLQETIDLPPKLEKSSMYDDGEICKGISSNSVINSITDRIFQNSVSTNSDTLELSISNVENQNNFTDSKYTSTPKIIHDWSDLSQIMLPAKSLNEHISNFSDKTTLERDGDMNSRTKEIYLQSKFFNLYDNKNENSTKGTNFTSDLREDLIHIVQTLNTIALTHISSGKEMPVEELRLMTELYKDLEIIVNAKISYVDEFLQSKDYKKYSKFGLRYMQKMVYSLIDTFDYVTKINMKTFGKNYKQVNFFKFSKNIYKIIFNFDKRWEKNLRNWSENMEKTKAREHKSFYDYNKNTFKRVKHWKKRVPFQNDSNKINKYKRHSVKY